MKLKNIFSALLIAASAMQAGVCSAQSVPRYPDVPDEYNGVFFDCVKNFASGAINSSVGKYVGQVTKEKDIYGYGSFFTGENGQVTGQFRYGNCIFGIMMTSEVAQVGTNDHYIVYDLRTGNPLYITKDNQTFKVSEDDINRYKFVALKYKNGDKYVGETVDGQRDGYGIYYYTSGNYYYGQYKNNVRMGYGAMFTTENKIRLEYWTEKDYE